jgi:hypothetical protein
VRYNCSDAAFWVLAYSLSDVTYGTTAADMWAANQCGDSCDSRDTAFLRCARVCWNTGCVNSWSCSMQAKCMGCVRSVASIRNSCRTKVKAAAQWPAD